MSRHAWILGVRPGYEDEYKKRHEIIDKLRAAGIRNYSIFRHRLVLIGHFERDDLDAATAYLVKSDVNRRWAEHMGPIMKIEAGPATNFPYLLPLQWHMD